MRRSLALFAVLVVAACILAPGCGESTSQSAYDQAQSALKAFQFTKAQKLYEQAAAKYEADKNVKMAQAVRQGLQTIQCYLSDYPLTESDLRDELTKTIPSMTQAQQTALIKSGKLEHITVDGKARYLSTVVENVLFRDINLFRQSTLLAGYNKFAVSALKNFVMAPPVQPWQDYTKPASYNCTETITVPRAKLPQTGTLQIWMPVPITSDPQPGSTVTAVQPADYVKYPQADGDIGDFYMEVPLEKLSGDLNAQLDFNLTHYEQHFAVDPGKVGSYDKSDPEYKQYTRSYGNTTITPAITTTARKVVGTEKNPYLQAKKIYDWIVKDITYSLIPETTCWPRGKPISVYVYQHRYGDCGGQSMLFSAMCRTLGIPARATGGFQLLSGKPQGHFWAEFFLPNYGWVPVDTSIGQMAEYATDVTAQQKTQIEDWYFANQDNMRLIVQKDVDVPLVPTPSERVNSPGALQAPDALCATMKGVPGQVVSENWTITSQQQ